jgi:serine/threonine-protein kinase
MDDLTGERWQQIDALFAAALERRPAERDAFLDRACGRDGELAREVRALLASELQAEAALGESATAFASPLLGAMPFREPDGEASHATGTRLGPYRVMAQLGRGGMGAVYLAERADQQFVKRVAIKLVKRGMDTDQVLRRFRYERQILASLEHPNIARLYDGGMSDDGRPYLVMEYIEGRPIDAYCDEHRLTVDRRLALFRSVCEAVQFAHQNLVIHRDLKPSNILVTPDGTIKLLDFGVAKLLQHEATDDTSTRTELRAFTPEYASPEQILGQRATTASDVYGLGVVLHQLLAGCRPSRPGRGKRIDVARDPAERFPDRPSDAARTGGPAIAAARSTSLERLVRNLRGDVDAMVFKALERDPRRRYDSARALAEDIERHLSGAPVLARHTTPGYRLWRYALRHRAGVGAATTFGGLIIAFAVFYSARITRARDLAERQRDKAEQVVGFLTGMLTAADPNQAQGDTLTVYDVLTRSELHLDTALAAQPEVREELWRVLGDTYRALGDYPRARRLLERSYALGRSLRGDRDTLVAATARNLADALHALGQRDSAERIVRRVLAVQRAQFGESDRLVAASLNHLGELRWNAGDADQGARLIERSLAINRRVGAAPEVLAFNLNNLGNILRYQGRHAEAERLIREALALRKKALGMKHPAVPGTMIDLGSVLRDRGDYVASESVFRAALDIRRRILGADHPDIASSMIGLAYTVQAQRKYAEAESLFRAAIDMDRRLLGAHHPLVGFHLMALGLLLEERGDVAQAESLLRSAIDVLERTLGPDHPNTTIAVAALGRLLVERGDAPAGEVFLRRAVDARTAKNGPTHYLTLWARADLGWCLAGQGRLTEAESILLASHAAWRPRPGVLDSAALRRLRANIVDVSLGLQKASQAEVFRKLLAAGATPRD